MCDPYYYPDQLAYPALDHFKPPSSSITYSLRFVGALSLVATVYKVVRAFRQIRTDNADLKSRAEGLEAELKQIQPSKADAERQIQVHERNLAFTQQEVRARDAEVCANEASLQLREADLSARESKLEVETRKLTAHLKASGSNLEAETRKLSIAQLDADNVAAQQKKRRERLDVLEKDFEYRKIKLETFACRLEARAQALSAREDKLNKIQELLASIEKPLVPTVKPVHGERALRTSVMDTTMAEKAQGALDTRQQNLDDIYERLVSKETLLTDPALIRRRAQEICHYIQTLDRPADLAVFKAAHYAYSMIVNDGSDVRLAMTEGVRKLQPWTAGLTVSRVVDEIVSRGGMETGVEGGRDDGADQRDNDEQDDAEEGEAEEHDHDEDEHDDCYCESVVVENDNADDGDYQQDNDDDSEDD